MEVKIYESDLPKNVSLQGDIAIDTETMGLDILRDRLCLLQISDEANNTYIIKFNKIYESVNLKALLLDKDRTKIFHFARFDLSVIQYYLNVKLENIFCTRTASKLCRTYTDSHSLKELCKELLGIQISKQQQCSNWGKKKLSKEQISYAANDVLFLHKIRDELIERLKEENRLQIAKKVFEFIPIRSELDIIGWREVDIFAH